jgi:hypothetical protein
VLKKTEFRIQNSEYRRGLLVGFQSAGGEGEQILLFAGNLFESRIVASELTQFLD